MKTESFLMKFFRRIDFDSIAWSLRRLYCPVKKDDLVLEIGSGGKPYFRANILCDAYLEETTERSFTSLVYDRPTILAFVENLPFRDDVFDFVIASHVLEHSPAPDKFLSEIQRVARAGYIETPDVLWERMGGMVFHRLEIAEKDGGLIICKKKGPVQDQELADLLYKASPIFPDWVSRHPFHFHIRYYWSRDNSCIKYKIINPKYKFDWDSPVAEITSSRTPHIASIKQLILFIIRKLFSQNKRNKQLKIVDYLLCLKCRQSDFENNKTNLKCKNCGKIYPILNRKILDFTK